MRERREAVEEMIRQGISERRACSTVGLGRSSYRYREQHAAQREARREEIKRRIVELARRYRRYGYRRITALMRRSGEWVNPKRIWRIWKQEGLSLPRRRPRRRRRPSPIGLPTRAAHRGHVWTYDFAFDCLEGGAPLKILVVLDEYTRECHRIRVGRCMDSGMVMETLKQLFDQHGPPRYLRSDNGGEFIAKELVRWLLLQGTETIHIEPGHPWENGYAESFIGKLRDECLNEEVFLSEQEAQVIVELWRRDYNEHRPHSSLGYLTPAEYRARGDGRGGYSDMDSPEISRPGATVEAVLLEENPQEAKMRDDMGVPV